MLIAVILLLSFVISEAQTSLTERKYLSGTGAGDRVSWDFYCTKGMKSGYWTTIPTPSCWEQEGFGSYNYGHDDFADRLNEEGIYRYRFTVPKGWAGREVQIVFEGVMTDAEVKVNGKVAGPVHQGAFYEFRYDISDKLSLDSENELEVKVSKHSANESVSLAERKADFWVFGGIFRPVYLEVKPQINIQRIAVDAKADGMFQADVYTSKQVTSDFSLRVLIRDLDGTAISKLSPTPISPSSTRVSGQVSGHGAWTAETPVLYEAAVDLVDVAGVVVHTHVERIGFRTVEVRESDGIYVNGVRIKLKGVNRHTFHPKHGRTSSKELSIKAVETIRDLNMNAVRMSHYPPDRHFLDVCDSLGLFVLDELTAWQKPSYDDTVGLKLLTEMIERDVNHPSIILWDNGNEGGENDKLTPHFERLDIQKREVLYPWSAFGLTNTAHYIDYDYLSLDGYNKRKVFFPTEFMHGLYDGGLGAGLEDYWLRMWEHPLCAGGFLWVFQDEAVERTDRGSSLDTDGNHAPDGILGPYYEKEGSYYAIKDIWSPIHFEQRYITTDFNGIFRVENRYHYTDFDQITFVAEWLTFPDAGEQIQLVDTIRINLPPGQRDAFQIQLPVHWQQYDALRVSAYDHTEREINHWSWPIKGAPQVYDERTAIARHAKPIIQEADTVLNIRIGTLSLVFDKSDGTLRNVSKNGEVVPLSNGPIVVGHTNSVKEVTHDSYGDTVVVTARMDKGDYFRWTIGPGETEVGLEVVYAAESRASFAGITFSYPESDVAGLKWLGDGPYRVYKNRMKGVNFGLWEKTYNNTVTGESGYEYPEFKGYHANVYWAQVKSKATPGFKVYIHSDDIFLRMFTPEAPTDPANTIMEYPPGDISFLNTINAIGTKFRKAESYGPQSMPASFDARKIHGGKIRIKLTFEFN